MNKLTLKYNRLGRFPKIMVWALIFLTIYAVIGFLVAPPIIKHIASSQLTELLDRRTAIRKIKLNPFTLSLTVEGLYINEKDAPQTFISFETLYVNLQGVSLFRLAPVVKQVTLKNPYCRLERNASNAYNFSDLIDKNGSEESQQSHTSESEPFRFAVFNIEISDGHAEIIDNVVKKTHKINDLVIRVPFISNMAEQINIFVEPYFSVNFNDTPIVLSGQTKPFHGTLETSLDINLDKIDLAYYFDYLPIKTNIDIVSGELEIAGGVQFYQNEKNTPVVTSEGTLVLKNLLVTDTAGETLLKLPKFHVKLGRSQLMALDLHVEKVEIHTPKIGIVRRKDATINIYSLFPDDTKQKASAAKAPSQPAPPSKMTCRLDEFSIHNARIYLKDYFKPAGYAKFDASEILSLEKFALKNIQITSAKKELTIGEVNLNGGKVNLKRQTSDEFNFQAISPPSEENDAESKPESKNTQAQPTAKESEWLITLKRLAVKNSDIICRDLVARGDGNISINGIQIAADNISTRKKSKGEGALRFKINQEANVIFTSNFQITPLVLESDMNLQKIQLAWGQPFIKDLLNLKIKDGAFNMDGKATVSLDAELQPSIDFKGNASINNLLISDKSGKQKLVKLKTFSIDTLTAEYPKMSANIDIVKLDTLESHITRKADGNLDLADIIPANQKQEETSSEEKSNTSANAQKNKDELLIAVKKFIIASSKVDFIDQSVTPYYATSLKNIQINVKNISSKKDKPADVNMSAKLDGHAPFTITGTLNPLSETLFADLDIAFKNMELSPVSPYSGKYVGKKIKKGKLSFDLDYLIKGTKLDSKNKVFIDQIELGEKVDSPDATNLPVGLGISLLKDRSGRINLDIPVSGDLDDPEFSLTGTILKVITNLLAKAATSPFSLLGSMFGGGEDINRIYFEPGTKSVSKTEYAKLDTVIKALFERPSLGLEIKGYADVDADRNALIETAFKALIAAEADKHRRIGARLDIDTALSELEPKEYEKYVRKVYKRIKKEQKKAGGFEEPDEISLAFMENAIKKQITIKDEELKLLADKRALTVKDYLLTDNKIKPERIFIVETDSLSTESTEAETKSRVELGIK